VDSADGGGTGVSDQKKPIGSAWVSTSRVADVIGVDRRTVARWADKGDVPAWRVGKGHHRIQRAWFDTVRAAMGASSHAGAKALTVARPESSPGSHRSLHAAVQPVRRPSHRR
jgi:excisionase family DNA binding protein